MDTTPVWIMRQAGRYFPEYRRVRNRVTFLELCKRTELAAEVTLTAQRSLGVDAAILFADLLPILEPMGFQLEYTAGETARRFMNPVRTLDDLQRVRACDLNELGFVYETVRLVAQRVAGRTFRCWALPGRHLRWPRTRLKGGGSRDFASTKRIMYACPELWSALLSDWPTRSWGTSSDRSKPAARPSRFSTAGPAVCRRLTIATTFSRIPEECSPVCRRRCPRFIF